MVRDKLGPVAAFKLAITVARLPKTRSGKILRGTIKKMADGDPWTMPATIEDRKGAGGDRDRAEGEGVTVSSLIGRIVMPLSLQKRAPGARLEGWQIARMVRDARQSGLLTIEAEGT